MIDSHRKKKIFWFITLSFPFLVLILLEISLRWVQYGDNTDLTFIQEIHGKKYYTINPLVSRRYFPSHTAAAPKVYDNCFDLQKTGNTYRIFCIGESTMQGFPYEYNVALPVLLKDRLLDRFQNKKLEVINLGITAINSYAVRDLMKDVVKYQPDLVIVYVGHNEFYGSFGVGSAEFFGTNRTFVNLYLTLNRLKVMQLLRDAMAGVRLLFGSKDQETQTTPLMELMARDKHIPFHGDLYETAKGNFYANLNDIVEEAKSNGVQIMLSTTVSNVHDQSPFVSAFSSGLAEDRKKEWVSLFERAAKLQKDQHYAEALEQFHSVLAIDSARADVHYGIAGCLESLGDTTGAKAHFEQARDYDVLRFRATGEFNDIIRDVAVRNNVLLADIVKVFEEESTHRIIGKQYMLEHVHPSLDGYVLIAKEFTNTMQSNNCVLPSAQWRKPLPDDFYTYVSMMTLFDFEVSFLRMDNLMHHWPFSMPDSIRYEPTTPEGNLARSYLLGKLTWEKAHYQLAEMYKRQRQGAQAEREYLALAKEFWYDYRPLISAGDLNMGVKNYSTAEKYFRAALEREDNQFTHVRLGALYQETSRPELALKYFQTALEIDASASSKFTKGAKLQLLLHLGQVYLELKDYPKARFAAKEALQLDPKFRDALDLIAKIEATDPGSLTH